MIERTELTTPALVTLCCVVDEHPRFRVELLLWVICAQRHLPTTRFAFCVYLVGEQPSDLDEWLTKRGVEIRHIAPVLPESPHCNKIAPFLDSHGARCTIVCDTDLFFVDDLSCFLTSARFRAPPNNHCNPPPAIFKNILAASGLERPYRPGVALYAGALGLRETHINNISGGLIVAPADRSVLFAQTWKKWAMWLVDNRTLLAAWAVHVDQVAFALAMEELGEDVEFLPPQTNAILYILEEIASVWAFHLTTGHIPQFPQRFNPDRTLNSLGLDEGVAHAIDRLNLCILEAVDAIGTLPSTRDHLDKFLNPAWRR